MSLDDAVKAAKAEREQQSRIAEPGRDQEPEIQELARVAAKLLVKAPRWDKFVQVRGGWSFGGYIYERKNFSADRSERCWVLRTDTASRTPTSWTVPSCVLLLERGEMGRIYRDQVFDPEVEGVFVTKPFLTPVPVDDPFWGSTRQSHESRVGVLKQELAKAIVFYGAA